MAAVAVLVTTATPYAQPAFLGEKLKGSLPHLYFSHSIPFAKLRGNVVRTLLGKSDFYWPLMVLAEQWQCSLYANVLFVQSSVPTMFLPFFANGRVTNRRVPPFPKLKGSLLKGRFDKCVRIDLPVPLLVPTPPPPPSPPPFPLLSQIIPRKTTPA